jgi:hypothetical protein
MSKKHLFTVRMLDAGGDYITHREHIVGRDGVEAYKKEIAEQFPKRRVAYCRIFNETKQTTRYEGGWIEKIGKVNHVADTRESEAAS